MLGREKSLAHGRKQVGAAGEDADVVSLVAQECEDIGKRSRASELEFRETHCSPLVGEGARLISFPWRIWPLPLNQSEPPCSRNFTGEVGSTPSVKFRGLAFFFARNAESTRSGVNGDSCKRIPTAS